MKRSLAVFVTTMACVAAGAAVLAPPSRAAELHSTAKLTISPQYAAALEKLPDWDGQWDMYVGPGQTHEASLMFDPEHVYQPRDPAGHSGGFDFGPLPGTYDTAIPYKPQYWKKYRQIIANNEQGKLTDPVGNCMQPHGMPRQMSAIPIGPYIVITPTMVLMHWTWLGATRYIFFDGRPHPSAAALVASYMGNSIAHWEGGTLVVDTIGLFAGQYDQSGAPFSDQIHVIERIRLVNHDRLRNEITVEDPVMLTRPWRVTRDYVRDTTKQLDLQDQYCPPGGNTIDYKGGFQNEVLPMDKDQSAGAK